MLNFTQNQRKIHTRRCIRVLNQIEFEIHIRDMRAYMRELDVIFFKWADRLKINKLSVTVDEPASTNLDRAKIKMHLLMQRYRPGQAFEVIRLYNDVVTNMERKGSVRKEILNSIKFQTIHVRTYFETFTL